MSGLTPEAEAFAAKYRAGEYKHSGSVAEPYVPEKLTPEAEAFRDHLARMNSDHEYATKVRESRKDCDKCDMEIAAKLSKWMGGKKRSKKRSNMRSKKNRSRRTTSHRRRSRARR
jgi:hypothetical protein